MLEFSSTVFLTLLILCKAESVNVSSRYYPRYHLAPTHGWMNDPNGFSIFRDEYHLFYQYNPESSQVPGIAYWGHAKSKDLFHWEHLPIAMYPDKWYDKSGVFSGSVIVENDTMYAFYTGNLNHPGENPDHEQHQALAISTDGVNFTKFDKNPIIVGEDRQPNFRDPKVWKHNDTFYMVLGNSFRNNSLGRALLYSSVDMISWKEVSILDESNGFLGYMYECPDFFELNSRFVLLFSPQGIKPQGDKYKNLYQDGYIVGEFDYRNHTFTGKSKFREMDHGHDFYATQSLLDDSGRRIVVAWLDMWEEDYPERNDGFTGQMTIPREIHLTKDGRLIQKPVQEIALARGNTLISGNANIHEPVKIDDNAGEVLIKSSAYRPLELLIESENGSPVSISYNPIHGSVTLDRGGVDGIRRAPWRPPRVLKWQLFIDASSIELFCGDGEVTFTSRFFPNGPISVRLAKTTNVYDYTVNSMKRTVPVPA